MLKITRLVLSMILTAGLCAGCLPAGDPTTDPPAAPVSVPTRSLRPPTARPSLTPSLARPEVPYERVALDSLLAYLEDLTSIQAYSGWRNSASRGEAEALDYVAATLRQFASLQAGGLELERQSFKVYLSTEIWDSRLVLTVNGREIEVPADGLRGSRGSREMAVYFDTDGVIGDTRFDPVAAAGAARVIRDDESLYALTPDELQGRILFVDYTLLDAVVTAEAPDYGSQLMRLIERGAAGVVLVTQYSNRAGESRGTMIGDGSRFLYEIPSRRVPIVYARIEDLSPAGITGWDDLERIEAARIGLDADVLSPGTAGSLIARIPGADSSKAVILGAHIDSPNSPGAFDNGSGSAALLEVARVLDEARYLPAADVYLAWFGGHEIGTYGSAHFVATHQELLDRTLGMIQMDGLGHPLDGKSSNLTLTYNTYGQFGDDRLLMPDFLAQAAASEGIDLVKVSEHGLMSDNSNFDAFNVPNVFLGYYDGRHFQASGSSYGHYANHWHDPYETVDRAAEVGEAFVNMARVMLAAALETGRLQPDLRAAPAGGRRALYVASHTETDSLPTSMLRELGMALAWEGFDVDMIPYGRALSLDDLEDAGILVLPPTLDYPGQHTEQWSEAELALLQAYTLNGGLLVVVNSACNYAIKRCLDDGNEDARSLNPLLEPMGIRFTYGTLGDQVARAAGEHPLTENAGYLSLYNGQGVLFKLTTGVQLFSAAARPIVGLVDYGDRGGQVLVIGDLGLLQADSNGTKNLEFLKNIARYAARR